MVSPTTPSAHVVFDLLGWSGAAALAVFEKRWRLPGTIERLARSTAPGDFAAVVAVEDCRRAASEA